MDTAELEVLLGETAETLAAAGGPFPPGLEVAARPDSRPGVARWLYAGDEFRRAIELTSKSEEGKGAVWRERAIAGRLRQQYPASETPSVAELSKETEAWIEVAGTARDAGVLQVSADRVGAASLSLARLLLALDRRDDLAALESRLTKTAGRIASGGPDHRTSAKLLSRVRILHAMRGDGSSPFPQEARARVGPKEVIVRITGKANALELTVETSVGGTRVPARKRTAVPVLPVPGTLRLAPDGRTAAWVEVAGPSKLVAVVASLESDVPAREIAPSSSGQPPRDGGPAHVLSNLSGYSKDGQRLGVSIETWTDTPGPEARYSVVSVATGEPMFETSKDLKSFRRLIQ